MKGCDCYGMCTKITNLMIQHEISVQNVKCGRFEIDEYSSLKFSKL